MEKLSFTQATERFPIAVAACLENYKENLAITDPEFMVKEDEISPPEKCDWYIDDDNNLHCYDAVAISWYAGNGTDMVWCPEYNEWEI